VESKQTGFVERLCHAHTLISSLTQIACAAASPAS